MDNNGTSQPVNNPPAAAAATTGQGSSSQEVPESTTMSPAVELASIAIYNSELLAKSMRVSSSGSSGVTSRPINYDGLGLTPRFILTFRPVQTMLQLIDLQVISNTDYVQFLLDNNVEVPFNSTRKHIQNMVIKLITQNPEVPPNYQGQDCTKDALSALRTLGGLRKMQSAPTLPTSSTAVDNQTTVTASPPAVSNTSTSTESAFPLSAPMPSHAQLIQGLRSLNNPNLKIPTPPWQPPPMPAVASTSGVQPSNNTAVTQQRVISTQTVASAVISTNPQPPPPMIAPRAGQYVIRPHATSTQPMASTPNNILQSLMPIPPPPVQRFLSSCPPYVQTLLNLTAINFGGWGIPIVKNVVNAQMKKMNLQSRQPNVEAHVVEVPLVAILPKQHPLPPLMAPAGAPFALAALQPYDAADSAPASSDTGEGSENQGAAAGTLDDNGPRQGSQDAYFEMAVGSTDCEVPLPCKRNFTIHTFIKNSLCPKKFEVYLDSKMLAIVRRLVESLADFGLREWARTSGFRLLLLIRLRDLLDKQVRANLGVQDGPTPATGTKRKVSEEEEGSGQSDSQPQGGASKRSRLQDGDEPVVKPKEYKLLIKVVMNRDDMDLIYVTEKMNTSATINGRVFKLNFNIKQIVRVWNEKTYQRYKAYLEVIREENEGVVNEFHLFHGSSHCRKIVIQGFDERCSNLYGMFGAGLYFTEHSYKSNNYAFGLNTPCPTHKSHTCTECVRQLLLCRVALGKTNPMPRASRCAHSKRGFHSVTGLSVQHGGQLNTTEYVVYRGEQAFPEFLISYVLAE